MKKSISLILILGVIFALNSCSMNRSVHTTDNSTHETDRSVHTTEVESKPASAKTAGAVECHANKCKPASDPIKIMLLIPLLATFILFLTAFCNKSTATYPNENADETLRDNRKTLYSEAGNWARHFSTVRMTVMTFTITTCVAIIAWKWQAVFNDQPKGESQKMLATIVGVLWGTGVVTFWIFTCHTYDKIHSQQKKRPYLPASSSDDMNVRRVPFDGASLIVPVLTAIAFCYFIPAYPCLGVVWKTVLWSFFTFSFMFPVGLWFYFNKRIRLLGWLIALFMLTSLAIWLCYNPASFGCHHCH